VRRNLRGPAAGGIAAGAAAAVYAASLGYGFIWDDPLVLRQLRAFHGAGDLLLLPPSVPHFYYRPVVFLTFLIDHALGGVRPLGFHATVVGWHVLATYLVYLLLREIFGADRVLEAGAVALLFAVHPVHAESVAWIAGRSDVVATALLLVALLAFSRATSAGRAWLGGAVLLLAFLAKEVALAGVVLIPAALVLRGRAVRRWVCLPIGAAVAFYFGLRYLALGTVGGGLATGAGAPQILRDLGAAFGWYFAKALWPAHLDPYVPHVSPGFLPAALGVAAVAVVAAAWAAARRAAQPVPALAALGFAAAVAPSLGVIVRRSASAVLAERYLYLPSVAVSLLAAWALSQARDTRWRRPAIALLGALILAFAAGSVRRARVWADDVAFWSRVVHSVPREAMPRRELAAAYLRRGELASAEVHLREALSLAATPEQKLMTYNNLGNLFFRQGRLDEAGKAYRAGLALRAHGYLYNGLGRVAMKRAEAAQARGDRQEVVRQVNAARTALAAAVGLDPRDYKSRVLLGQVLLSLGDRSAAREQFRAALRIEARGNIAGMARRFLAGLDR